MTSMTASTGALERCAVGSAATALDLKMAMVLALTGSCDGTEKQLRDLCVASRPTTSWLADASRVLTCGAIAAQWRRQRWEQPTPTPRLSCR